MLAKAKT